MKATMYSGKFAPIMVKRKGMKFDRVVKDARVEHLGGDWVWVSFDDEPGRWYPVETSSIHSMEVTEQ